MIKEVKERLLKALRAAGRFLRKHRVATAALSCCLVLAMLMSVITVTIHEVHIVDGGVETAKFYTILTDEENLLKKGAVTLGESDLLEIEKERGLITVQVTRAFPVYVTADGETVTLMMTGGTAADALKKAALTLNGEDRLNLPLGTPLTAELELVLDRVRTELFYKKIALDYETERVKTDSLYEGETKVKQEGENGEKIETYSVTYVNGEETARELITEEVTKEPVNRIVLVGTKVKPNVITPAQKSSSAPASYKQVLSMTATAYVAGGTTATGRPAVWGVVAVDPRVIPLGTRVYVETPGGGYVYGTAIAADTGGAIKGNKIDICVNSESEAYRFGRRPVNVYILD